MPEARFQQFTKRRLFGALVLGLASLASPASGQGSALGPQAQAKIQIRVSVRPMVRLVQPGGANVSPGSLCLWSNYGAQAHGLRAEWNDGQSVPLDDPPRPESPCPQPGAWPVQLGALEAISATQNAAGGPVMLIIEGR